MHPNFSVAAIAACMLLNACTSTPEASQNAADNNARYDAQKVQAIEKAIHKSDLGLTPMTAGTVIRVPMPLLTEERRREITKVVRHDAENARVAVRNVRRDVMSDIKDLLKEKLISQDDERRAESEVQKLTDKYVADIDQVLGAKEKEIMQV